MEKPIKAFFVFPLPQLWGGENIWLEFLARISRDKFMPFVLTFGQGELQNELEKLDIPYQTLAQARIRNFWPFFKNLLATIAIIKKQHYDVVNSLGVNLVTTLAAKTTRAALIIHIHTIHPLSFIDRWCLKRAKRIVTICQYSKNVLLSYGVAADVIEVIYNGIDIDKFQRKATVIDIRSQLGLSRNTKIICYAGRIVPWKNIDILIRAIPYIKERCSYPLVCLLVGDAPLADKQAGNYYKDKLIELSRVLSVEENVKFLGRRTDIAAILSNSDVFALPSHLDTFPLSLLEAMVMSKAIVAFGVGGIPELLAEGSGVIIEPHDIAGFGQAIAELLNDEQKRVKLGQTAFQRVKKHYDFKNTVTAMEAVQEKVFA